MHMQVYKVVSASLLLELYWRHVGWHSSKLADCSKLALAEELNDLKDSENWLMQLRMAKQRENASCILVTRCHWQWPSTVQVDHHVHCSYG